jgi:hydroxymethylglutaryl-CoA reductase
MKKKTKFNLVTISADQIAKNLKRTLGEDKAVRIAHNTAKELHGINTGDVNSDIFDMRDIRKNEHIWTQVYNILEKGSHGKQNNRR